MLRLSKFIILCLVLRCNYAVRLPVSPCPNVFAYDGEPETDRWYGFITFSSNIELVGLNYKVQLDRPAHLLVSWDGEVRSDDNINFSVFDPFHIQRAREIVKVKIMVKFSPDNIAPGIAKIIINGNTICSINDGGSGSGIGVGLSGTTPGRPDPSFSEEDKSPDYSNNRGGSKNNYNSGSSNTRPNSPNYGNEYVPNNAANYGSNSNVPSYNQNTGSSNQNVPSYGNSASSVPNYVNSGGSNFGNNANSNPNYASGSNVPNYGSSNSNPNYVNPSYGSSDVNYPNQGTGTNSGGGQSQSQWPETQQVSPGNKGSGSGINTGQHGYVNPQGNALDSNTPIVTTLALQNGNSNKSSIDQILLNIKNQLDQSPTKTNNTVIVAVVYPTNNLAYSSTESRLATEPSTTHRTTTTTQTASTIKIKNNTPSTVKQNNQRNKD